MFSVLVGRWWVTVQFVQLEWTVAEVDRLTGETSRVTCRLSWVYFRRLVGRVGSWVAKIKLFICCIESVWNVNRPPVPSGRWRWCRVVDCQVYGPEPISRPLTVASDVRRRETTGCGWWSTGWVFQTRCRSAMDRTPNLWSVPNRHSSLTRRMLRVIL